MRWAVALVVLGLVSVGALALFYSRPLGPAVDSAIQGATEMLQEKHGLTEAIRGLSAEIERQKAEAARAQARAATAEASARQWSARAGELQQRVTEIERERRARAPVGSLQEARDELAARLK